MISKKLPLIFKIVIAIICVFLIFSAFKLQFDINDLKEKISELEELEDRERYETEHLQSRLDDEFDDEYVKDAAKEKLNYGNNEDKVFYNSTAQ